MNYIETFKNGSGIHIKKKNRGKFTDYCGGKVTEECIQRGKHSSNPTTRKRATFAANARKWKHEEGGIIKGKEGVETNYRSVDTRDLFKQDSIFDNDKLQLAKELVKRKYNKAEEPVKEEVVNEVKNGWEDFFNTYKEEINPTIDNKQNSSNNEDISEDLKTLIDMFNTAGIKFKVTSGFRKNAITKQGKQSHHATGNAIDIVPLDGNFETLANAIRNNPEIVDYMKSKGLGILDETTAEMLARTGGTGPHYHIGPDKIAQQFWTQG